MAANFRRAVIYIPSHFVQEDDELLVEIMRAESFALLISNDENGEPFVTHLPVIVRDHGDRRTIEGHMARANPHWQYLENNPRALIVFNGPHAYVSPSLYESKENVPTWNYIAVHAYGAVKLAHDMPEKHAAQTRLIDALEPGYKPQFDELRPVYLQGRMSAIVAFEMSVERLEGKFKLSQNRPMADRRNVAKVFAEGNDEQRAVAAWMRRVSLDE
jgi:transcriptional regulator